MMQWDALRGVTLRALRIDYISPAVCELAVISSGSGSSGSESSVLNPLPVTRREGPTNLVVSVSAEGVVTLTWEGKDYIFSYAVYVSSVSADGPFVLQTSNEQDETFSFQSGPGTFWAKVTGLEETYGETYPSNTVQFTVS